MRNNNSVLYHYTDFQALDGILMNSELRLNNVLNMNDASEMRLFMRGLCDAVEDRFLRAGREEKAFQVRELFRRELEREIPPLMEEYSCIAQKKPKKWKTRNLSQILRRPKNLTARPRF